MGIRRTVTIMTMALFVLATIFVSGCGKSSFEEGKELYDKGFYEQALPLLQDAKKKGDHFIQAEEMIRKSKEKVEEQADQECVRRAENFVDMLAQSKTVDTWDRVVQELKSFRCRKVNVKPYVDKAYFSFIAYLSEWDAYPQAVSKYCEHTGCEAQQAHILIREEEITITDDEGKEKEETIQQEIPIAQHSIAMEMFKWLVKKDIKTARWFDRYCKFLYDNERYQEALEAYKVLSETEGLGFELKSRSKLAAEHLGKGGRKARQPGDNYRFFWIEDVKKKSKLKALKRDLEEALKQKEQAEQKAKGIDGK